MQCPKCHGNGAFKGDMGEPLICGECMGSGIASCCDAAGSYADPAFSERMCDRCGKRYRGPAVYCSLACAIADA